MINLASKELPTCNLEWRFQIAVDILLPEVQLLLQLLTFCKFRYDLDILSEYDDGS